MKNNNKVQSMVSAIVILFTVKRPVGSILVVRPVENEELFDHLFLD